MGLRAMLQTLVIFGRISGRLEGADLMSAFKGRHFEDEIVLWAVRWYVSIR
jgi:hypothetical protein